LFDEDDELDRAALDPHDQVCVFFVTERTLVPQPSVYNSYGANVLLPAERGMTLPCAFRFRSGEKLMSTALYGIAQGMDALASCNPQFAASLLESDIYCMLIDSGATVIRASDALLAVAPGIVGKDLSHAFRTENDMFVTARVKCSAFGIYRNRDGELIPAVLRSLYAVQDTAGATLIGVTDGAPFREAETQRFASTPYAIMRVTPDGIIRYANDEARWTLASDRPVVGRPLASLLGVPGEDALMTALAECIGARDAREIDIVPATATPTVENHKRLLLTPDMAPNQKVLGVLAVIQSSIVERVRDEVSKLALDPSIRRWPERLAAILERIRPVIDFDHANFGVYADNVSLFKTEATYPLGEKKWKWPARWMELHSGLHAWLNAGKTWVPSIPEFVGADPVLRRNEVVQHYEKLRVMSSVTLVAKGAKGPTSALTLCSLQLARYGEKDLTFLRELHLEQVLIRIEEEIAAERQAFAVALRKKVAQTESLHQAAQEIVKQVAEHFHWDSVALFRVDRHRKCFELVHQNPGRSRFRLPERYRQNIGTGMLAETLREQRVLTIDNIGGNCDQHNFFNASGRPSRSAMTIPMRLNHRVRWIFDIESDTAHVFRGPDRTAMEELVEVVQDGLTQRMSGEIKRYLLREAEQGVLVVGIEGGILEMNDTAAKLLGRLSSRIEPGEELFIGDYLVDAEPELAQVVSGYQPIERHRITLRGDDSGLRSALGTRTVLEESFDTAIWFLTDIENDQWTVDLSFLRETVSEVAQQTRAPLAMASTMASAMARRLSGIARTEAPKGGAELISDVRDLCGELTEELGKADITFERLAEGMAIRKEPLRPEFSARVDLARRIDEVIEILPARDRKRIDFPDHAARCEVIGDAGRLGFMLRSLIAYLLRARMEPYKGVGIRLTKARGYARLTLCLTPSLAEQKQGPLAPPPSDALWQAFKFARDDAGLARSAIEAVIKKHSGTLEAQSVPGDSRDPSPGWTAFKIELPLAKKAERKGAES
jgi:putative methionine-R-sulfoxide reductase with GAF domain